MYKKFALLSLSLSVYLSPPHGMIGFIWGSVLRGVPWAASVGVHISPGAAGPTADLAQETEQKVVQETFHVSQHSEV